MEKYRVKCTIYKVFLLVTLFISGVLLYMLIGSEKDNTPSTPRETNTSEDLTDIKSLYREAYNFVNGENSTFIISDFPKTYKTKSCTLVNFNGAEKYFTNKAIKEMSRFLDMYDGNYYDCNKVFENKLNVGLFGSYHQKERDLTLVSKTNDLIIMTGKLEASDVTIADEYPLYIVFKNSDNKWLIDSFE